jgi:hypothetical protein
MTEPFNKYSDVDKSMVFASKFSNSGTWHFARDKYGRVRESVCGMVKSPADAVRVRPNGEYVHVCGRCESITRCPHESLRVYEVKAKGGVEIEVEFCLMCGEEVS